MPAPKISIIIPVYNAAAYIEQCIYSVLHQTMKDIEVIAVNDGSTDSSAAILDTIAATDSRLRVFHNSNKGVSAARNLGMQQATGEWTGFTDADDFMEPAMLEELYHAVTTQNCNWAICNVQWVQEGKAVKTRLQLTDGVIDTEADRAGFIHGLMRFQYDNANWNKLFNTAIIRQQGLQFNTAMHIWEDLLFNLYYLQFAGKVAIVAKPLYNYRLLPGSIQAISFSKKIAQFNQLYKHYIGFAQQFAAVAEQKAFQAEMARITYNQLLYQAEVKVFSEQRFFPKAVWGYRRELLQFNPSLFQYTAAERKGLQGIKKQLLQQHYYTLFAFIMAAKPWLKKPYRLMQGVFKKQ